MLAEQCPELMAWSYTIEVSGSFAMLQHRAYTLAVVWRQLYRGINTGNRVLHQDLLGYDTHPPPKYLFHHYNSQIFSSPQSAVFQVIWAQMHLLHLSQLTPTVSPFLVSLVDTAMSLILIWQCLQLPQAGGQTSLCNDVTQTLVNSVVMWLWLVHPKSKLSLALEKRIFSPLSCLYLTNTLHLPVKS